jgi:hypothetical protein
MATRIIRIDDIDGSDGAEAVTFELDHKAYEIDLCARNRIRFLRAIEPFIDRARPVVREERPPRSTTTVSRAPRDLPDALQPPSDQDPASEREPRDPDLIDMIRQVQG